MFNWLKKLFHREQTSKKEKVISGVIFFIYIFAAGFGGNMMNGEQMEFYDTLMKPGATPPNWVFPIVWPILFFLIGLSAYFVWNHFQSDRMRKVFTFLYFVNGILVYLWPRMFFVNQSLSGALYVIIGIIIVAELMILTAFRTNHKAAFMLLPYLLWVLFATYLNTSIIALNV